MVQKLALGGAALLVLLLLVVYAAGSGWFGSHETAGVITGPARSAEQISSREDAVLDAARELGVSRPKQVLFGDLHVHTTFSFDAFTLSLPTLGGEGAHPPADACDFARYCAGLDFWSINDHAFSISPKHWQETVEAVRQCNEVAGPPEDPDMVAFLGWEWTQVGITPDDHYGHKNVILASTEEGAIPTRPISSLRIGADLLPGRLVQGVLALLGGGRTHDLIRYFAELRGADRCDPEVHARELPDDCMENAATPDDLFRKLDEWGHEAIVIPHGTTWGFYTPPGSTWDKQLSGAMHDPKRQTLIEVYSGHGNSEVYRDWRAVEFDSAGNPFCPEPRANYLPSCWRAGEIIRERCAAEGLSDDVCEVRAATARSNAAAARIAVHRSVPASRGADWLDAGQCLDCDQPSFNYRPGGSAQYIAALGNFEDDPENPRRFRFGFMASSDNHFARPGTGYKEVHRAGNTESRRASANTGLARILGAADEEPNAESVAYVPEQPGFQNFEGERQASFFMTGGLVGVHSEGRDRTAIWDALQRREVFGTSGPHMLIWFDLLNAPGFRGVGLAMGGETRMEREPIFQVRAVGSFEQEPGCPEDAVQALDADRMQLLCKGECYHPSDRRRPITRIEIVRIRPQRSPGENVAELIDDPWRTIACDEDPVGCAGTFTDPDFSAAGRDTLYYARAFEAEKPGINAANLRCQRGPDGDCSSVELCPGPLGPEDDCLAPHEPRAWSSPIYVDFGSAP